MKRIYGDELMDEQKRPRAWVYARIPGDYDGTMNSYKVCSMQALHDGCDIVGGSIDERGGWLLRPGYRDMLRQIEAGKCTLYAEVHKVHYVHKSNMYSTS